MKKFILTVAALAAGFAVIPATPPDKPRNFARDLGLNEIAGMQQHRDNIDDRRGLNRVLPASSSFKLALIDEVDEKTKIEALKLGYLLNGNSMVRWGSIDLTGPAQTKRMLDPSIPQVVIPTPPRTMDAPR